MQEWAVAIENYKATSDNATSDNAKTPQVIMYANTYQVPEAQFEAIKVLFSRSYLFTCCMCQTQGCRRYFLKYILGSQGLKIFLDQPNHIYSVFTKVPFHKNYNLTNARAAWRWKISSLIKRKLHNFIIFFWVMFQNWCLCFRSINGSRLTRKSNERE